ncbi:type II secretion system protein N [Noviherbaspirillum sp.]|uniref:type II secretion system protein N n=1 Tax=Noviherbaspirillum sp. TaxID=1926288 RepID=UPI002D26032F|nr:type II secretion system protein N [Noviherbaspirillum sp.]HZW21900.1 type II secretion system protein N [Noviherbaspirillum sp.]
MRRLPLTVSFLLFVALCASAAYWAMQLFKPPVRPVAAPPRAAQAEIRADTAATLFGSPKGGTVAASNYQLRGVIFSGSPRSSVAIISADGKPAQAIGVEEEVAPGVTIKEVHRDHVLLSEGGATKRVDLPESAKGLEGIAEAPVPTRPATPPVPVPGQPVPSRAQAAAAAQAGQPQVPPANLPQGQPAQVLTPQNAPAPQQPVVPMTQPVPGAAPPPGTTTTAPPTSVVNPGVPGVPGQPAIQQPGAIPGAVPGAVPGAPQPVPGAPR